MEKTKIFAALFTVLMLIVTAAGCSSPAATSGSAEENNSPAKGQYTDGTYEGISDSGMYPGLKVSVVVKDGVIAEVNVVEHSETQGVGTAAIEKLPPKIIEAQSTEVDSVTGASLSSAAIKEAVEKALVQAK